MKNLAYFLIFTLLITFTACATDAGVENAEITETAETNQTEETLATMATTAETVAAETTAETLDEPESEPLNNPPDGLSDEELLLWDSVVTAAKKEILYYDIADYEGNGEIVMFAAANDEQYINNYDLWYTNGETVQLVEDDKLAATYFPLQFGDKRFYVSNKMNRMTMTDVYGVKDGKWYVAFRTSGRICMGESDYDKDEIIVDLPSFGLGWIYYWFYFDEEDGVFKEYGAKEITLDEFIKLGNAEEILAYGDGYELKTIFYRDNGAVTLVFFDEESVTDQVTGYLSVIARDIDGELVFENIRHDEYKLSRYTDVITDVIENN